MGESWPTVSILTVATTAQRFLIHAVPNRDHHTRLAGIVSYVSCTDNHISQFLRSHLLPSYVSIWRGRNGFDDNTGIY